MRVRPPAAVTLRGDELQVAPRTITRRSLLIGRAPEAWLRLEDDEVSLHHASVTWSGAEWRLADLSSNGTWVDGARVPRGEPIAVTDETVFRMGATELRLVLSPPPPEVPATKSRHRDEFGALGAAAPGLTEQQREAVIQVAANARWRAVMDAAADELDDGVGDLGRAALAERTGLAALQLRGILHRINKAFGHTGRDATRRSAHVWRAMRDHAEDSAEPRGWA